MDLVHSRAVIKPLVAIILSILKCMFYSKSISSAGVLTPPHNLVCGTDHYKDFSRLYTDGSRMGNQVAAAVVKLPDSQTQPAYSVLNCMLSQLHWLSFVVANKTILLSFQTISSLQALSGFIWWPVSLNPLLKVVTLLNRKRYSEF